MDYGPISTQIAGRQVPVFVVAETLTEAPALTSSAGTVIAAAHSVIATILSWMALIGGIVLFIVIAKSQAWQNYKAMRHAQKGAPMVTCPSCHTKNPQRVTGGQRVRSAAAGGILFSRKAKAQFHCLNCNYYW